MYKLINTIKEARGNEKQAILSQHDHGFVRCVLKYTYDPFKRYYMKPPSICGVEGGSPKLGADSFELLDALANRVISGNNAMELICDHITTLDPDHAKLFKLIMGKDLRMGMGVKTINKVFPGLITTHDVMLAKKIDWDKVKYPCYASIKYDGIRGIYRDGKFYTRAGHIIEGIGHLERSLGHQKYPLDGELMVPGEDFQTGSGMIRSKNETPTACFHVFDVITEEPFEDRLRRLSEISAYRVNKVNHFKANNGAFIHKVFKAALNQGHEGLIIKSIDHKYQGKRSADWMKIKDQHSEDLLCTGLFEGEGKYAGQMGGIIVDRDGVKVKVGTGFSDEERKNIWSKIEYFVGKLAEVEYMEVTPDGSLRHPRFKGWRWDKKEVNFE